MKLVHLADLHVGFRQYHRLTLRGMNQREADIEGTFQRAVDLVIRIAPDLVVIGGDIFHTVRPMNPAIVHAFTHFARMRRELPDVPIIMVAGNHDQPRSTETGSILALFEELDIDVAHAAPKEFIYPERDLFVLAIPDLPGSRPQLLPPPGYRHNVLLIHGEVEGVLPAAARVERAALEIKLRELNANKWSYVALGHYHVHKQIAANAYYSGSLDYTSTDPWSELREERALGLPGKGLIEYDLDTAKHTFHHLDCSRCVVDLLPLLARGMSPKELDLGIKDRLDAIPGGIDNAIVRLVVQDVPRHIGRELNHRQLREYKRRAFHLNIDLRRPVVTRMVSGGAPGRRPMLGDVLRTYLGRRPLDSALNRDELIKLGVRYLDLADASAVGVHFLEQGGATAVGPADEETLPL
ncbi:MAG: metallophosphoesterase [Anaerolineae bacterium]|nr:metallophosphoesterase [Gemmatimonadaceae bacterium]